MKHDVVSKSFVNIHKNVKKLNIKLIQQNHDRLKQKLDGFYWKQS